MVLVDGHSVEDPELKYGLSVTGWPCAGHPTPGPIKPKNARLREELGRKGKIRAVEFSWEQTARDTFQAFRRVWKGDE